MQSKKLPTPSVIRSWQHLYDTVPGIEVPQSLPITALGTTYSMAQELAWIDFEHFAVGRWDGSMSIFEFTSSPAQGPLITEAVTTPSSEGMQMITWLSLGLFATSNDEQSMLVWQTKSGTWTDLAVSQTLSYSSTLGVANSATSYVTIDGTTMYFIAGHANGYVTIWKGLADGSNLSLIQTINVQSSHPVNPWNLYNVRGLSMILWDSQYGYVVTGSEDGDLCVIRVPDGTILSRTVYNPNAQRGINSISTLGQNLLVANCAVGSTDKNLWYYWIDANTWQITLYDSVNLQVNPSLAQVFNFDVIWGYYSQGICWFSTTEEGLLWMGSINNQSLGIIGNQQVTSNLGAAVGIALNGNLALAAYDLYEYNTIPQTKFKLTGHPERFMNPGVKVSKPSLAY